MKRFGLFLLTALPLVILAQTQLRLEGEAFFPGVYHPSGDTTGTSDVWAWTDPQGEEYVLVGVKDGIAVIRASDMQPLHHIPGPSRQDYYYHRDIKTFRHYAYVSSEMRGVNEGIQVIDLSGLPDTVRYLQSLTDQTITSHNLSIDTARFRAYITGSTFEGVYVYDLFDPANPLAVAYLPETNVHDVFARNDSLWVANSHDYSIWNMVDPGNPVLIARLRDTTFGYCHNIWPTKDGRHFVTTEETGNRTVKIWSLSPAGEVALVSEFIGPSKLVHNAHVEGDFLFLAHYSSGVIVVDIADPSNPVPVAEYDTYPLNDTTAFYGCWGVYPHSRSGYIYASNFEGKVQKFRFNNTTALESGLPRLPVLVFPNPGAHPALGFRLEARGQVRLTWTDASGKVLIQQVQNVPGGDHRLEYDASKWAEGTYYFQLQTPSGSASGAWLKQ